MKYQVLALLPRVGTPWSPAAHVDFSIRHRKIFSNPIRRLVGIDMPSHSKVQMFGVVVTVRLKCIQVSTLHYRFHFLQLQRIFDPLPVPKTSLPRRLFDFSNFSLPSHSIAQHRLPCNGSKHPPSRICSQSIEARSFKPDARQLVHDEH
jgi:hypothetical protein